MKDTQHTPGPWHLSECAHQTTDTGICSGSGLHITDVNGYGMRDDQNQANARLIAAAPDLLAALEKAGGAMIVTADHGNCELMVDPVTGGPGVACCAPARSPRKTGPASPTRNEPGRGQLELVVQVPAPCIAWA